MATPFCSVQGSVLIVWEVVGTIPQRHAHAVLGLANPDME